MIPIIINGKKLFVSPDSTIMEAAKAHHILIPNFCYLEGVHQVGACRICVVEVEGERQLQASCMVKVRPDMVIHTNSAKVKQARRILFELMLSDHPKDCLNCSRNQSCEFQKLGERLRVQDYRFEGERSKTFVDTTSPSIIRDTAKCILCRRCVTVCNTIQGVGILNVQERGFASLVGPAATLPLNEVACTYCGQCTTVCPVGALKEVDGLDATWAALSDPKKTVIVQTAPAIRAALGEPFGLEPGTLVTGRMVTALKEIGFDGVFDTNFAADLTILEEGSELLKRLEAALTGGEATLPMITSCSPGWIKYVEHTYPSKLAHLSTCKSPHTMMGALIKTFYATQLGIAPEDIFVVSVMPCTAKKFEITRPEMSNHGLANVDVVLTTRELAQMILDAGIDFAQLSDSPFDAPLGLSSGAADLFANTGGVMEAALRTVYELVTGKEIPFKGLNITALEGLDPIKTASITILDPLPAYGYLKGVTLNVAVTSGLKGAKFLMEQIKTGTSPYHFIEVMGCPGGCISGGGQPRPTTDAIRHARMHAIYQEDAHKPLRKSHENSFIQDIYDTFLGAPLGHLSHELLHTTYTDRSKSSL